MATDRNNINNDLEPGLQQILEPSGSVELPQNQGHNLATQSARRKTIYTRTELFNRTDPNDLPQTSNATALTVPPKPSFNMTSNFSLTQMPTEIDLEKQQDPIKKTQSVPNTKYDFESILEPVLNKSQMQDCDLKQSKDMPGPSSLNK